MEKVRFLVQYLKGRAQEWAIDIWNRNNELTTSYKAFLQQFQVVFDCLDQARTCNQRLLSLRQGSSTDVEYTVDFQIIAADNG